MSRYAKPSGQVRRTVPLGVVSAEAILRSKQAIAASTASAWGA
jgi:hypothetical protein